MVKAKSTRSKRPRLITTSYRRSSHFVPPRDSNDKGGYRYKPFRPLLRPPRPVSPSAPPLSPPSFNTLDSLPVELRRIIMHHAVEERDQPGDEEWLDLATLRSFLALSKNWWAVAAPLYWRVLDLNDVSESKLANFRDHLSLRVLVRVETVRTPSSKASEIRCQLYGHIIRTCLRLSRLEATVFPISSPSHVDEIPPPYYRNLKEYSLQCAEVTPADKSAKRALPAGMALTVLGNLNPKKLDRLRIVGPPAAFDWSACAFSNHLQPLTSLTSLHLKGVSRLPNFHLSDLAVEAPLRAIHLDLDKHSILAESLMRYLAGYRSTLQHFTLVAVVEDEPLGFLVLPILRHLRLAVPSPHLLLPHIIAPLELLDLRPRAITPPPRPARSISFVASLSSSLQILIASQSINALLPLGGLDVLTHELKVHGVLMLWRRSEPPPPGWGDDVYELEGWVKGWKTDREKASFLEEEVLTEVGLTAEFA